MDKKTSDGVDWQAWQTSFMNAAFTNLRRLTSIPFLPGKMEPARFYIGLSKPLKLADL